MKREAEEGKIGAGVLRKIVLVLVLVLSSILFWSSTESFHSLGLSSVVGACSLLQKP